VRLHVTEYSPYCLLVRAFLIEKGIEDRVELAIAQTRVAGSAYYATNPSGRVPYLELDDGRGLEDSRLIVDYLDALAPPMIVAPSSAGEFENGRIDALARSFLDGLAVWTREQRRAESERSAATLEHESARAERLADRLSRETERPSLDPRAFNLGALTLAIAVDHASRALGWDACEGRPTLAAWMARMRERPSLARVLPK
jgi:glutathione S-transferase